MAVQGRSSRLDGNVFRGRDRALAAAHGPAAALVAPGGLTRRRIVTLLPAAFAGTDVRVAIDGGRWSPWSFPDALPRLRLPEGDGPHRIGFQARSARGVRGPVMTRSIRLDRRPADIAIRTSGSPGVVGEQATGSIMVTLHAHDAAGVRSVAARIVCGGVAGAWMRVAGHRRPDVRLDVALPPEPGCRVEVRVRDAAGNRSHAWGSPWIGSVPSIERRDVMRRE